MISGSSHIACSFYNVSHDKTALAFRNSKENEGRKTLGVCNLMLLTGERELS